MMMGYLDNFYEYTRPQLAITVIQYKYSAISVVEMFNTVDQVLRSYKINLITQSVNLRVCSWCIFAQSSILIPR